MEGLQRLKGIRPVLGLGLFTVRLKRKFSWTTKGRLANWSQEQGDDDGEEKEEEQGDDDGDEMEEEHDGDDEEEEEEGGSVLAPSLEAGESNGVYRRRCVNPLRCEENCNFSDVGKHPKEGVHALQFEEWREISLRGLTLKVVVKLVNILLTPEKPAYLWATGALRPDGCADMEDEEVMAEFALRNDGPLNQPLGRLKELHQEIHNS
ncbi:hypothetical protein BT69DRAFT_1299748 [Atractiella rhizophila]|nr:hypothetical protein BT69DRAFT_1299748 [Atractiella rhizophila]